jgi:hypothetical protein
VATWALPMDRLRVAMDVSSPGQRRKWKFITKFNGKGRTCRSFLFISRTGSRCVLIDFFYLYINNIDNPVDKNFDIFTVH